jgi:hypothetical protein
MNTPPSPINGCSCGCHASGMDSVRPAWLTPEQVVEYVRGAVTLGTLRNYRSARVGPRFLKVGRTIFYTVESIDAWLAELTVDADHRWRDEA